MATNRWANSDVEAGRKGQSSKVSGGKVIVLKGTFEKTASDTDTSILKLAKLPANAIPAYCKLWCDALTGASDVDLGLYKEDGSAADANIFLDSKDIAAGNAITSPIDGLTNLGGADPLAAIGKKLYELLGLTAATKTEEAYILALSGATLGTAAGTISYEFAYTVGA